MFFKIALKSAIMHKKRSLVIIMATGISVALLTLISSLIGGVVTSFYQNAIQDSGHVRIKSTLALDAIDPNSKKLLIDDKDGIWKKLTEDLGNKGFKIEHFESILNTGGLLVEPLDDLDAKAKNAPALIHGVDITTFSANRAKNGIKEGSFLPKLDSIAISERLSSMLKLKFGARVQMLVVDLSDAVQYREFVIDGIFKSENGLYDETNVFVRKETLQDLLSAQGKVSEVRFTGNNDDRNLVAPIVSEMKKDFHDKNPELALQDWSEINKSILSLLGIIQTAIWIIRFFFIIVAASIITNTILMSVFERVREYGTLRAIGLKKSQQRGIIILEALILGFIGSAVGILIGTLGNAIMSINGIDLGGSMETFGIDRNNKPNLDFVTIITSVLTGLIVTLVSSIYAARVASKKSVVESLGSV